MPAKNHLNKEQKTRLLKFYKESENSQIRDRVMILLLLNDGKTYQEISNFLEISYPTVAYWVMHGDPNNLESFNDGRAEGNFKKATQEYINILLITIEKEPAEYGYEFGRWSAARLANHLEKQTGIKLSGSQVRRILERKKYVYLWAKYSLESKQDPEKRKRFKEKLRNYLLIAKTNPEKLQVWFWDESGFSLRVIRRKTWTKKGQRKKVNGIRRKGRVNIMGALRYTDKKRICFMITKGDSETFYNQISNFYLEILEEWVKAGNRAEDFREKGPKIIIVLDNASYHKKQGIVDKITQELPNIKLEYLPPYSPDYNLIELVWHSTKEYIANKLFKSVQELEELLNKLLNNGELIIKWERKIKNKGNAVY